MHRKLRTQPDFELVMDSHDWSRSDECGHERIGRPRLPD